MEYTHNLWKLCAKIHQALSNYLLCFWEQFRDDSLTKLVEIHVSCLQWVILIMKHFLLWSVEIFFPGFYHVYLALNKWYFHWRLGSGLQKGWKEKKNQTRFIEIALLISFSQFKIYTTQTTSIKIIMHAIEQKLLNSYKEIVIHLQRNPAGFLLPEGWNLALKCFCSIGSMGVLQLESDSLRVCISRLKMQLSNYVILDSSSAHWTGCRFEPTQSKLSEGVFCLPPQQIQGLA